MLNQLEYPVCFQIKLRQHIVVKVLSLCFELSLGQIRQIVVGLTDQLLRADICVNQETPTSRNTWKPLTARVTSLICSSHREGLSLESTNATPVRNLQHLNPGHKDLKDATAEVVRQHNIWVDHEELGNEYLHELLLSVEQLNV